MTGIGDRPAGARRTPATLARTAGRRLGMRATRLGPVGSVRSEAGARAAVVAVSLLLSLGLTGLLRVVLAVAG
ncbi:MAG TPA: hypothetical protein VK894_03055 [Jiangellales bacterium]|nr:hypothetical protein [Jiangellales bacterium]